MPTSKEVSKSKSWNTSIDTGSYNGEGGERSSMLIFLCPPAISAGNIYNFSRCTYIAGKRHWFPVLGGGGGGGVGGSSWFLIKNPM